MTNVPGAGASVNLQLKGEIWLPVQATPANLTFGRLGVKDNTPGSLVRSITVVNNLEDAKLELSNIRVSNAQFKVDSRVVDPGKKYELTVSLAEPFTMGAISGSLEMDTGIPRTPKLTIPLSAYVSADVEATPPQIAIPSTRTAPMQRQVYVRNNVPSRPVKVSEVTASNPAIKVSIRESSPGSSFIITVDIAQDYKPSEGGDRIVARTDHPQVPTLTIPINEIRTFAPVPAVARGAPGPKPPANHAPAAGAVRAVPVDRKVGTAVKPAAGPPANNVKQ